MNFTRRELRAIMEDSHDLDIKKKVAKMLKLTKLDIIYTFYIDPKGKISKKYPTADLAHAAVEKIIGKWSTKTASKWREYEFIEVEYGTENSYAY